MEHTVVLFGGGDLIVVVSIGGVARGTDIAVVVCIGGEWWCLNCTARDVIIVAVANGARDFSESGY